MTNKEAFEAFQSYWLSQGKALKSVNEKNGYIYWLKRFFEFNQKTFDTITMIDIQKYIANLRTNKALPATINAFIHAINAFYPYCNEFGLYKNEIHYKQVGDKGKKQRLRERGKLRPEQVDNFVDQLEEYFRKHKNFRNARMWVTLYLLFHACLRKSEAMNLTDTGDIVFSDDLNQYIVYIRNGKGGLPREATLPASFKEPYELYIKMKAKYGLDCSYLLCTFKNKKLYDSAMNDMVNWMQRYTGLENKISPHRLRQGSCNYLHKKECPEDIIRQKMGHKSIETTREHYFESYDVTAEQARANNYFGR